MDANTLLSQEVAILKAELKKADSQSQADTPRNGRSILGSRANVLSSICANRKIAGRRYADSKKLNRMQAKHAKILEAEQQAQKSRDLAEAEHEASRAARDNTGGNWYIDTTGSFL